MQGNSEKIKRARTDRASVVRLAWSRIGRMYKRLTCSPIHSSCWTILKGEWTYVWPWELVRRPTAAWSSPGALVHYVVVPRIETILVKESLLFVTLLYKYDKLFGLIPVSPCSFFDRISTAGADLKETWTIRWATRSWHFIRPFNWERSGGAECVISHMWFRLRSDVMIPEQSYSPGNHARRLR